MFDNSAPTTSSLSGGSGAPQMRIFGLNADIPLPPPVVILLLVLFSLFCSKVLKFSYPIFDKDNSPLATFKARAPASVAVFAVLAAHFYECHLSLKSAGSGVPFTPVKGITRVGSYAYTRNPLYVMSLVALFPWMAFTSNSWYPVGFICPVMWFYFEFVVIPAEEAFLLRHHGMAYDKYRQQVPRWLFQIQL